MATLRKNLSDYLEEIEEKYGRYFPERTGIELPRESFGPHIKENVYAFAKKFKKGEILDLGELKKEISEIITIDGVKIVFKDNSWIMIRPSGTEPKIRIYIEALSSEEREILIERTKKLTNQICTGNIICL